jgi:Uma2 family endonuclease
MQPTKSAHRHSAPRWKAPTATGDLPGDVLLIRMPTSAATLAGFRAWFQSDDFPEQGRISFIGQEIFIDMSKERLESHVAVKTEVTRVLATLVLDHDLGKFYSDDTRVSNEAADLSNEPDATFVSWKSRQEERVRAVPCAGERPGDFAELEGTPDWVLEIVSPSSVLKDTERLRERYHRAGIPEYWRIDARGEEVRFEVLLHRPGGYAPAPRRAGWQKSRVFGCSFRLQRQRDRLREWQYQLQVRPG